MITARINVKMIDKARLFTGEKGTYLDIVLIETPNGKYGNDYMVKQSISKEDREAGAEAPILGNGKIIKKAEAKEQIHDDVPTDTDSLPF